MSGINHSAYEKRLFNMMLPFNPLFGQDPSRVKEIIGLIKDSELILAQAIIPERLKNNIIKFLPPLCPKFSPPI